MHRWTPRRVTMRTSALALVLLATAACATPAATNSAVSSDFATAGLPTASSVAPTSSESSPTASSQPSPSPTSGDSMATPAAQPIRITIGDSLVAAELDDSPTVRDLLDQLPLTLTLQDYNRVEKTAALPRALTVEGAPRGADPELFDIGYYAPGQVLVLYYGDVGFFNGIVRLGRFDPASADLIESQPDDTVVTIEASA